MGKSKLNHKLQAARTQRMLTLGEAAGFVGVDIQTFWRWEHGTQGIRPYALRKLCEVFGMPAEDLGFGRSAGDVDHAQHPEEASPGEKTRVGGNTSPQEMAQSLGVPNVTSHKLFEIGIKALSLVQKQQRWSYGELLAYIDPAIRRFFVEEQQKQDGRTISRRDAIELLASLPIALLGLDYTDSSLPVAEEVLPFCVASIPACWKLYFTGGITEIADVLPDYIFQLSLLAQQPSKYQKVAASLVSQAYQLDWLLALQHQDFGKALSSIKQSFQYADIADDSNLRLAALVRQAHISFHLHRPMQQVLLQQKAMQYCKDVSPLLQGWLYIVSAESYAHPQIGNEHEAQRLLGLAHDTFPDRPENDPNFSYVPINQYTLANHSILTHLHLKQPTQAWNILTEIEKDIPTAVVPRRVELLSRKTATLLALGDMHQTCESFELTVLSTKELGSALRYNEACETYEQMQLKWPQERKVKALVDLLKP